jgi:glycosyltransferase involved in cell wall biosynthesis
MMESDRLAVCLASQRFYPTFTGSGRRFQGYAPGLGARGIDLRVFAAAEPGERLSATASRNDQLLPVEYLDDLMVQHVQLPQAGTYRRECAYVSALVDYCRQPSTRPNLIQALSVSQRWLPWRFSFRRLRIPFVYTKTMVGELSTNPWKWCLQRIYWRIPFLMADCVVVSSTVAQDAWRDIGVKGRIEVIPNGVNLICFRPATSVGERQALRLQLGLDPVCEVILFVGGLIKRKGVDVLVEAWRTIAQERPRACLVLVGPGREDMRSDMYSAPFQAQLEAAIASSGAAERVICTGQVDNVEAYFQAADLFVFPSRREGMGNVVMEALACALPTIVAPFIGLPDEFGRPGEQYVLVERTPEALAQATIALLANPERRQQLGHQGRRWAEERLDVEKSLDQYAALYRELVERSEPMAGRK